jgi:hypothetical protein
MDSIIISGYLTGLSDNIIPFIEKNDVFVHTWSDRDNERWINKLERYRKYTNSLSVVVEQPKYSKKLYSYFYSTYRAVNLIPNIDIYNKIVKFKPNLIGDKIKYRGDLTRYFNKASLATRPLLKDYTPNDCIYGTVYYKNIDERIFSGYPLAYKKLFHILDYEVKMKNLHNKLLIKYGEQYEGSIFWTEWCTINNVPIVTDTDLNITNNKM